MDRGKRLIWLVLGMSLVGLIAFRLNKPDPEALIMPAVASLLVAYCAFRRQQWARWLAVLGIASWGAILVFIQFTGYLLGELQSVSLSGLAGLGAGTLFLLSAGILTFSEAVGDLFVSAASDWSRAALAAEREYRPPGPTRIELQLTSSERKHLMGRLRVIVLAIVCLGVVSFLAIVGWNSRSMAVGLRQEQAQTAARTQQAVQSDPTGGFLAVGAQAEGFFINVVVVAVAVIYVLELLVFGYLALFFIPFLVTLPFVLPFAREWYDPATFLILRPFNKDRITAELAMFLREELAAFGHCYTLSDRKLRVPLRIRVPILWGQISFFNFRFRKIRRPQHIEKLVAAMRNYVRRNLNWCFSQTKLFPVSCCDPGWQACVARLVQEVDVVIADVSSITPNVSWELERLRDTGALAKTIFVAEASQVVTAQQRLVEVMGNHGSEVLTVFPYGSTVASNDGRKSARVIDILCREFGDAATTAAS